MFRVAFHPTSGVTVAEMQEVIAGWSAKKNVLGKLVYNDANQKIGSVDDVTISPEKSVSTPSWAPADSSVS